MTSSINPFSSDAVQPNPPDVAGWVRSRATLGDALPTMQHIGFRDSFSALNPRHLSILACLDRASCDLDVASITPWELPDT